MTSTAMSTSEVSYIGADEVANITCKHHKKTVASLDICRGKISWLIHRIPHHQYNINPELAILIIKAKLRLNQLKIAKMSDKDIYRLITSQNIATSMVFKISQRRFNIEIACRSIVDTEILKRVSQRHPSLIKSLSFTPKSVPIVYQSSSEFLRQSVLITPRCRLKIITVFQTMIPNFLATNI